MDTLTHSLLGALVVRSVFPRNRSSHPLSNRQRMLTGALAAAFPDMDYVASFVDPMVYLTLWHRSITHSFVLLPLWALLLGLFLAVVFRQRSEWRYLTLLAGVSIVSHILSDLITVYGTQILSPLSGWRASVGTTFIIDPWFTLIVLVGCLAGFRESVRYVPQLCLAVLVVYVGFQAFMKQHALSVASAYLTRENVDPDRIDALPQPLSPFNWKLLVTSGTRYDVAYVNLAGGYRVSADEAGFWAKFRRTYRDPAHVVWETFHKYGNDPATIHQVRSLWEDSQLDYFRRFAGYPAYYRTDHTPEKTCVWFTDLRYVLPYMTPPFRYGLCREKPVPKWNLRRLRRSGQGSG